MNTNSKKDTIIRICNNMEPPITNMIMNKIQQLLGICLLDDTKIYIQYTDGVIINLDQVQFTDTNID